MNGSVKHPRSQSTLSLSNKLSQVCRSSMFHRNCNRRHYASWSTISLVHRSRSDLKLYSDHLMQMVMVYYNMMSFWQVSSSNMERQWDKKNAKEYFRRWMQMVVVKLACKSSCKRALTKSRCWMKTRSSNLSLSLTKIIVVQSRLMSLRKHQASARIFLKPSGVKSSRRSMRMATE